MQDKNDTNYTVYVVVYNFKRLILPFQMTSKIQSYMQKSKLDENIFANFSAICIVSICIVPLDREAIPLPTLPSLSQLSATSYHFFQKCIWLLNSPHCKVIQIAESNIS